LNRKKRLFSLSFVCGLAINILIALSSYGQELKPLGYAVPREYFGIHIHRAGKSDKWPTIPFGGWRLWDAYVAWPNLEAEKGRWDFKTLDRYVILSEKHSVQILLPLGLTPSWASARPTEKSSYAPGNAAEPYRIDDWRNYVKEVGERYKGRINHYEIWNEPNSKNFFTGSIDKMVELSQVAYKTLKEIDSKNIIVSPAVTGGGKHLEWFDRYLAKGGGQYADVIGYHFYPDQQQPETTLDLVKEVQQIMAKHGFLNKPLWNTEFGWLIETVQGKKSLTSVGFPKEWKPLTMNEARDYLSRALILNWATGIDRIYWYAWDNQAMGLLDEVNNKIKPAAEGFSRTVEWLEGSIMNFCTFQKPFWICKLTKSNGRNAWIVWCSQGENNISIPPKWQAVEYITLNGYIHNIDSSHFLLPANGSPVLVKPDRLPW
jgi:hypothetical protein